ncbi:MAG: cytochrome C oxidase subunit IV family protein [Deltaproteobacteria bacterium]|nr:cytochrome C oxidase subunit IV family protein [Deltaproteobacteria bacterium]
MAPAHPSPSIYVAVFMTLVGLTALTVWAASAHLGAWSGVIALSIATTKATLVVLYFMHVRYGERFIAVVAVAGAFWLAILVVFVLADVLTRSWLPILVR